MLGNMYSRLRRAGERVRSGAPRGLILMYHRVAEKDVDPWSLSVTPVHFAEHLAVMRRVAHPVSLSRLGRAHADDELPDRAVALTFDDGYANNLYSARPLLERADIPATVFIATGYSGQSREFWWDALDQALLRPGWLPANLCLDIGGAVKQWELGDAAEYSEAQHRQDFAHYAPDAAPGSRLALYWSVWETLQRLPADQQRQALDAILAWSGCRPVTRPTHRSLRPDEISLLARGGLVSVGAHTVNHPLLPAHPAALQRDEIRQSKAYLEEVLGHPVTSFSYPFGGYGAETVPLVREAGFRYACSTIEAPVLRRSDRFLLPRYEVSDWNGEEIERRVSQWFGGPT